MAQNQIDGGKQIRSGTVTTTQLASAAGIVDGQLATAYSKADGSRAFTGEVAGVDPTSSTSLATKNYVDGVAQGLDTKGSVRVATTTAGTLASSFANGSTVDGVTLATADRILIKDQASGLENGIYTVAATGAPTRSTDANTSAKVTPNLYVFVEEGTANADSGWTLTNNGAITLNTTALVFTQFTGAGQVTVDSTITKTGNALSRAALTGDVTASGGSNATTIAAAAVTLAKQASLAANSVIGNLTGSGATPVAVPTTAAATASTVMARDTNANVRANSLIESFQAVTSAAGTTTLTVGSPRVTQVTGTTTQTIVLPDATTLVVGQAQTVTNRSTGVVTVNANGGGLIQTMAPSSQSTFTVTSVGSSAGAWDSQYAITNAGAGGGTVTTASVATANGFAGTVASATTTPVITLTTSITGLLKGNGTAISAATASTDYMAPASFVDRETPSGTVNGSTTSFGLANTPLTGSEHVYLNGLLQEPGAGNDYTISGATITYLTAPVTGDKVRVSYRK